MPGMIQDAQHFNVIPVVTHELEMDCRITSNVKVTQSFNLAPKLFKHSYFLPENQSFKAEHASASPSPSMRLRGHKKNM